MKNYFDRWLESQSASRLKVSDVKEKVAVTVVIDIVTKENSLAQLLRRQPPQRLFPTLGGLT